MRSPPVTRKHPLRFSGHQPPTIVQSSLVGPVGSLLHVFEVGMLLTQPGVKNGNPYVSTLCQKESTTAFEKSSFMKYIPLWDPERMTGDPGPKPAQRAHSRPGAKERRGQQGNTITCR